MLQTLAIAAGGALGAVLRYWVATAVYNNLGRDFPWGTLLVNVLGSVLIGFLAVFLAERVLALEWRAALFIGFLGAFTTFSTFSLETVTLLQSGALGRALANILVSVLFCVVGTWFGMLVAKQFS